MFDQLLRRIRPVTLTGAVDLVINHKQPEKHTKQWYLSGVMSLVDFLGDLPARDVTAGDVRDWWEWLNQRDNSHQPGQRLSAHTKDSYARSLRAVFNVLVELGAIDGSPFCLALPKPPKKGKKSISDADIEKMVRAAGTLRDQALILALRDAGCRLNALVSMTVKETTFNDVDGQLTGRAHVYDDKVNDWHWVFFQERASQALTRYLLTRPVYVDTDHFWLTQTGRALTRSGAYQVFKRVGRRAGVTRYNPHAFRHSKVKRMIDAGAPHKVIQDVMGWRSDAMIQEYVQTDRDDLQAYSRRWDPLS